MILKKICMAAAFIVLCACSAFHLNAQTVTGTLRDSLTGDQNSNGITNPGDSIAYKAKLKNASGSGAVGVQYNNPTPANTQLGTNTRTSALARNDVGAVVFNGTLTGANVLSNDFGVPSPSVLTYGPTANPVGTSAGVTGTTNGGGSVLISSAGELAYTPAPGFTGNDQFAYIAGNGNLPNNSAIMTISVGNPASAANDSYNAVGNVSITLNAALGVKANDGGDATVVETVQGSAGNVGVSTNTANNGQVVLQADGSFNYNPPPGFEGTDNFTYTVDNGFNTPALATVNITVAGMIWFVNNNAAPGGNGRLSSPFDALSDFSNGAGGTQAGDNIFIYTGSGNYSGAGGITLLSNQKLIGAGAQTSLAALTGLTPPSYSASLPPTLQASPQISSGVYGVQLNSAGTGNMINGFAIISTGAGFAGVFGTTFGTLTVADVSISTAAPGIDLSNGAVSGSFLSVTSTSGNNNIRFNNCTGSTSFSGTLSGSSANCFNVIGGSISFTTTASGSIAGGGTSLVTVSGGHTGTLNFNTGTLSATSSSLGLDFSSANGTYNFNGTTTLTGGSRIMITSGSGTFNFGSNTSIPNSSFGLSAFTINGGTSNVTYSGNIATTGSSANPLILIAGGHVAGTVTFNGTIDASVGLGLSFTSAGGTYNFNGTTNLHGGNAGIDIASSSGTFNFGTGTTITSPSGIALDITGSSSANVTYSGNITQASNAAMVSLTGGQHTGTILFQTGALNATNGTGLQFDNADGTYNFSGTTTLNGGDAGIDILNNSGGSFTFVNAPITNSIGFAINILSSSGTVNHSGSINHSASGLRAVNISGCTNPNVSINGSITLAGSSTGINVSTCSGSNITFAGNISSNIAQTAITVANNTSSGTITFSGSSKSFSTSSANAVLLNTNTGVAINFINGGVVINTTSGTGLNAIGGGTVTITRNLGTANTINTTAGFALNVANTTIGSSNLIFQSISAAGAANGIVLNNTGSAGNLTITGTGNSSVGGNSSGGTIQNTTGTGISLTNTTSPSFTNMNIQNTGSSGIGGTQVTNCTIQYSFINNSGTGNILQASNIGFNNQSAGTENNLSGVVIITGNTLTNAWYQGIDIFNFAGTISNATISNNTITSGTTTGGNFPASVGSGIRFVGFGSATTIANITKATINNNTITNFPGGVGLQVQGGNANSSAAPSGNYGTPGNATNIISISGNTISGQSPAVQTGGEGMITLVNGVGQGHFSVAGNTVRYNKGTSISASAFGNANVELDILNNIVTSNNIFASQGIGVGTSTTSGFATNSPHLTVKITGNSVSQTDGNGILAVARDASAGILDVSIKNNTVAAPLTGVRQGIRIDAGNATGDNDVCLDISGNTSASSVGQPAALGIGIRKQGTSPTVNAFGVEGMGATNTPGVESYINGLNPSGGGTLLISASSGFTNCASAPN